MEDEKKDKDLDIESGQENEEEISFDIGKAFRLLKSKWKTLLIWTVCGFAIGCGLALCRPHKFEVVSKIAPELSSTTTSRISSLASMIGMSSLNLGTTDAIYPMVYPDFVHSPYFISELFKTPVSFEYEGEQVDTTLFAYFTEFQRFSLMGTIMSLPGKLFPDKEEEEELAAEEAGFVPQVDYTHFTRKQGRVYNMLRKAIEAEIDKKTLVVTIKVTMDDPQVCATVATAVNENLKESIIYYRTSKAVRERDYYMELRDKNKAEYDRARYLYSSYSDSHRDVFLQSVLAEKERLRSEVSLLSQIYSNTVTQLQNAEAKILQETPAFAEIIQPTVPLKPKDSRKTFALVFAFLFFCCGVVYVFVKAGRKS